MGSGQLGKSSSMIDSITRDWKEDKVAFSIIQPRLCYPKELSRTMKVLRLLTTCKLTSLFTYPSSMDIGREPKISGSETKILLLTVAAAQVSAFSCAIFQFSWAPILMEWCKEIWATSAHLVDVLWGRNHELRESGSSIMDSRQTYSLLQREICSLSFKAAHYTVILFKMIQLKGS